MTTASNKVFGLPCELVGTDDGYNQINTARWAFDGDKLIIAEDKIMSRGKRGRQMATLTGAGSGIYQSGDEVYTITRHLSEPEDTRSEDYPVSPLNRYLIHAALNQLGISDGQDVAVITGLPLKQYNSGTNGVNERLIKSKTTNVLKPVSVGVEGTPSANIIFHGCYSEAIGGVIDYLIDFDSNGEPCAREGVNHDWVRMALDIGGNTTDMAIINPDNTVSAIETIKFGVSHMHDRLKTLMENRFEMSLDSLIVDEAIRAKEVFLLDAVRDVSDLWETAVNEVLTDIFHHVEQFRRKSPSIREIVGMGGGVALCETVIKKRFKSIVIVENPDGANARGFLKAATFFDIEEMTKQIIEIIKAKPELMAEFEAIGG